MKSGFLSFLILMLCLSAPQVGGATTASPISFPSLLVCEKGKNVIDLVVHHQLEWSYPVGGPLRDVQAQPDGSFLVAGGANQVSLVRRIWRGFKVVWNWGKVDVGVVQSAVGAFWDPNGHPTLILAADSKNSRIFLAEARSYGVKIRWEYSLPSSPLRVHICPDTGNFLVVLKNSTVEEVHFQEDKVVWSIGPRDGFKNIEDAVRGPWGRTYVADAGSGSLVCLDRFKKVVWKTPLPHASGIFEDMALSLFRKHDQRFLLASVHLAAKDSKTDNLLYLLDAGTGEILGWSDRLNKGFYPDFFKVTLAQAFYYDKQ